MGDRLTDPKMLAAEIARLPDLGLAELRARWLTVYGRPAPRFFRSKFLVRAIAHQLQVNAYGGLTLSPECVIVTFERRENANVTVS